MNDNNCKAMFSKKRTTEFTVDFVFDNLPDYTSVVNATSRKMAILEAKKELNADDKNLLIKTYVHEEEE